MLTPQFLLPLADELMVDLFAGGGGASCGMEEDIREHAHNVRGEAGRNSARNT